MSNPLANIPTDHLYKFIALSGVATALSSVYLFVSKVYEYKDNLLAHKDELSFISPVTQIGCTIGFIVACVGFWLWYVRIQKPLDKELKAKSEIALLQVRKDKEALDLSKYEKTYQILTTLENHVNMMNLRMIGDLGYGVKFDAKEIPAFKDYNALKMNIDFYIPELSNDIKELDDIYLKFGKVIGEFIMKLDPNTKDKEDFIIEGSVLSKRISSEVLNIKNKLNQIAHSAANI